MKLYVSGPMAGYPAHNRELFNEAAKELQAFGYDVVNPAEIDHGPDATWDTCLRGDLRVLLDCEGVATIGEWQASRGASLEVYVAKELRMPVLPCGVWLARAGEGEGTP